MTNKLYYLASPYSSENQLVRVMRYETISYIAAKLIEQGYFLIEPIASCHDKALKYGLPIGYEYWKTRDRLLISRCDAIIVAMMPGWKESVGVKDEIEYAESLGKEVIYFDVDLILETLRSEI